MWNQTGLLFKSHPWHGVPIGKQSPSMVTAYIELVPGSTVKYELDKYTGYLKIDRPQIYSSLCPSLYGMLPQTYAGRRVAEHCNTATGRTDIVGDKDPLDICVITERLVPHGDILVNCRPIGGLRMIDQGEADDKIIAVMNDDLVYNERDDISKIPDSIITRLKHYFLTYKKNPNIKSDNGVEITDVYGREEAYEIIRLGREDYNDLYPGLSVTATSTRPDVEAD